MLGRTLLRCGILYPVPGAAAGRGEEPATRTATRPPMGPAVASSLLQVTILNSAVSPPQHPVTFFWSNQNPAFPWREPACTPHSQELQSRWGPAPSPSVEPTGTLYSPKHR